MRRNYEAAEEARRRAKQLKINANKLASAASEKITILEGIEKFFSFVC